MYEIKIIHIISRLLKVVRILDSQIVNISMRGDYSCLVIVSRFLEVVIVVIVLANAQDSFVGKFRFASEFLLIVAGFLAAHCLTVVHG